MHGVNSMHDHCLHGQRQVLSPALPRHRLCAHRHGATSQPQRQHAAAAQSTGPSQPPRGTAIRDQPEELLLVRAAPPSAASLRTAASMHACSNACNSGFGPHVVDDLLLHAAMQDRESQQAPVPSSGNGTEPLQRQTQPAALMRQERQERHGVSVSVRLQSPSRLLEAEAERCKALAQPQSISTLEDAEIAKHAEDAHCAVWGP